MVACVGNNHILQIPRLVCPVKLGRRLVRADEAGLKLPEKGKDALHILMQQHRELVTIIQMQKSGILVTRAPEHRLVKG